MSTGQFVTNGRTSDAPAAEEEEERKKTMIQLEMESGRKSERENNVTSNKIEFTDLRNCTGGNTDRVP